MAAAARRIQAAVLRTSTAAAPRSSIAAALLRCSPRKEVFGLPQPSYLRLQSPSYLRLQKSPFCASPVSGNDVAMAKASPIVDDIRKVMKASPSSEDLVDLERLKEINLRILKVEAKYEVYKSFRWVFLGPIFALLMSIPSVISVVQDVSKVKERQKNLEMQIEFLDSKVLDLKEKCCTKAGIASATTLAGNHVSPLH
ncbi:hypothetical protein ACP70R_030987 [Stipagrostis hirtigluma subsp. patula]